MAPFVAGLHDYAQVQAGHSGAIFSLNVPSRWASRAPFTNLTFDWNCPGHGGPAPLIGGGVHGFTYGELSPRWT